MIVGNLQSKRRIIFFLEVITIFWIIVIIRLIIVQFVEGEKWTLKAKNQAYVSRQITASRGIIYDRTEKNILAQSSSVETVSVNPVNISDDKKENVAKVLSEIFNLDYEKVLKKVKNNKSKQEIIVRKVDKETADKLRNWMNENNIFSGINIDEDMKRYYPYGDLASHIIGFVGSDIQGLEGIEAKYNDVLTGKKGSISKMLDAKGNSFGDSGELFEEAESGDSIVLTIDKNIQAITEKYLEEACIENECTDGGNVIIMDPRNGDILAMATYPNYNLNNPFEITNEEVKAFWYEMDSTQKNLYLQKVW